jgi:hypothetical protein
MYNERPRYTAPSPYDEPTGPIDVRALRAWWAHRGDIPSAQREAAYPARRQTRRTA